MKKQRVLFSVLAFTVLLWGCHLKEKRARQYHDDMLRSVQVVIDSSLEYGDALQSHQKTRAMNAYAQYAALVNKSLQKVQTQGNFEGDTTLLHYSLELLGFYKAALDAQFKPALAGIKAEAFTDDEAHDVDSLYENLTMNESQYWDRFNWAEKKFYKDNRIEKTEAK
jgi:hypothetical protein